MDINLIRLKGIIRKNFPPNSLLRCLIESERDELPRAEWRAKADLWWKLMDLER